ncbi:MAG TPA: hypothetical protein PK067_05575 [Kaistella chaponensis]|jgi:hypothetical protein|nr:hypothetical protein [Kaistella chaponensis]
MKKVLVLLLLIYGVVAFAQTPRFTKYNVASTSVQIYLPTEPKWDQSTSEDGSEIFIYDDLFGNMNYSAIIVKLHPTVVNDKPENLLESYMIYLEKAVFTLDQKAGFGKGHTLENQPNVKGILQMGKSKDGKEYKIMGWTDGKYIAVLATSSLEEMNYNIQEMFLRGIRFPQ